MSWVRRRTDKRRIHDLHELLGSTFPSPAVALDRECGDDYVELLGDVDLLEASLAGALSWGSEVHRSGLVAALEQAVDCRLRWDPLMTETQRDALNGVVHALRRLVTPGGDMIDDSLIMTELADEVIRRDPKSASLRYTARLVGRSDRQLDVELTQAETKVRTWIALPGSLRPQPWLVEWESHEDPKAWVRQLVEWLDEEMYTGGLGPAYRCVLDDGVSRLVVDGYGFRRADEAEHQRLRRAVGPHGWHMPARKRQIVKQYAAEWALDEVERQVRKASAAELLDPDSLEWSLTAPDGTSVFVEAGAERSAGQSLELVLIAQVGLRGGPHGRRRISGRSDRHPSRSC